MKSSLHRNTKTDDAAGDDDDVSRESIQSCTSIDEADASSISVGDDGLSDNSSDCDFSDPDSDVDADVHRRRILHEWLILGSHWLGNCAWSMTGAGAWKYHGGQ